VATRWTGSGHCDTSGTLPVRNRRSRSVVARL
jgi:hypothetical protein